MGVDQPGKHTDKCLLLLELAVVQFGKEGALLQDGRKERIL